MRTIKGWGLKNHNILIYKFYLERKSALKEAISLVGGKHDVSKIYQVVRVELDKIRSEIREV